MKYKASKRDIEASNQRLINDDTKYRMVSFYGEIKFESYMKIDNTNLPPDVVAKMIQERFFIQSGYGTLRISRTDGVCKVPPIPCSHTGLSTVKLASLSDGSPSRDAEIIFFTFDTHFWLRHTSSLSAFL